MKIRNDFTNKNIAAVIIGRNEGQRLIDCLKSLIKSISIIIYVDSGSTDNSVESARSLGVHVLPLDMTTPFTAARARNEGADYLMQQYPTLEFIQFVDGDCEVQQHWIQNAEKFLTENSEYAVVCGRRRERFPERSVYNQLCDIEWDTPIGDALACGGDALIRTDAFNQVDGYNGVLIAGEEPEMCFRLRLQGWKIRRIEEEMTLHDASMTKVGQWWNRARRAGYAYASSYSLHGSTTEKFRRKELLSIIFWVLILPSAVLLLSLYKFVYIFLFLVYPIQIIRIAIKFYDKRLGFKLALFYGTSTVIAKWPQLLGILKFGMNKLSGKNGRLIEYK